MSNGFHYSVGGTPTSPSDLFFREFTLSANTTLVWPFAGQDSVNVAARLMLVNVSIPSLNLLMPPANQSPVGYSVIIANLGSVAFSVDDNAGGIITTLNPGDVKYLAVRTGTTPAGTWYVITFGAGTSAANASALAGLGLTPIASTLNANFPFTSITNNQLLSIGDRAGGHVWTSGTGVVNFDASTTLTNGWWTALKNLGSGPLTLTPFVGDQIDGASTQTLNSGDSCLVLCSGTYLYTIGIGRITTTTDTRISKSVSGNTDVTLTAGEAANDIINFTGTLTGNINVIFPTNVKNFFINNNTSGAFALTCKTAAGTGIQVVQGNAAILTCDGTNIIVSQSTLSGTVTGVTAGTGLTGGTITGSGTIAMANTGVGAGNYGDGTHFPIFTVNSQGQLTSANQITLNTLAFYGVGAGLTNDGSNNLALATTPGESVVCNPTNSGAVAGSVAIGLNQLFGRGASGDLTSISLSGLSMGADGKTLTNAPVTYDNSPGNPTGTNNNTTGVMAGLGGSITPVSTGSIEIIITGSISNGNAPGSSKAQIRYGTGTPPSNGVAPVGNPVGGLVTATNTNNVSGGVTFPFVANAIISGLSGATPYWIDLMQGSVGAGTTTLTNIHIAAKELK